MNTTTITTTPRTRRYRVAAVAIAAALAFAACGDDDDASVDTDTDTGVEDAGTGDEATDDSVVGDPGPAAGACLEGSTDCDDMGVAPEDGEGEGSSPAMGMCAPDTPDCNDMIVEESGDTGGEPDSITPEQQSADDETRARARDLLGVAEDQLEDDIRIGRRGEETFALTEDYAVGRLTVELDDDGSGTFVVVSVTAELNSGPETITG